MNAKYKALLASMISPLVLNVLATSGTAAITAVEAMGARKEQYVRITTMQIFRDRENRRYCSISSSVYSLSSATGMF